MARLSRCIRAKKPATVPWSPKARRRFLKNFEQWKKSFEPHLKAIRDSERLTEKDFGITITRCPVRRPDR